MIPEATLKTAHNVRRDNTRRAHQLNERNMPLGKSSHEIIDWLNVEHSERYKPAIGTTYCNIYAYDYCFLMGAYMPRIWWTEKAIEDENFEVYYGNTVKELNVNALYEWFPEFGKYYGWTELKDHGDKRGYDKTQAQRLANEGFCVVMLAANPDPRRSGHIVCIVPENETYKSVGANGVTIYPVMSQAGTTNKKYFTGKWWGNLEPYQIWYNKSVNITATR